MASGRRISPVIQSCVSARLPAKDVGGLRLVHGVGDHHTDQLWSAEQLLRHLTQHGVRHADEDSPGAAKPHQLAHCVLQGEAGVGQVVDQDNLQCRVGSVGWLAATAAQLYPIKNNKEGIFQDLSLCMKHLDLPTYGPEYF